MYTFLFYFLGIGFTALYSYLLPINLTIAILLSTVLGFLSSLIFLVITIIIEAPIMKKISYKNKFKKFLMKQIDCFACNLIGVKVSFEGRENIPLNENYIVTPNHKSLTDILAIYQAFPAPMGFIAKAPLFKIPVLNKFMIGIGCVSIDRNNDRQAAEAIIKGIKQVKDGLAMTIFPEGGIKSRETAKMVEIKPGAYKMATKSKASILPVSILNGNKVSKRAPWRTTKVKVIIHKPISFEEYKDLTTQEIGEKVFEIVNSVITD